MPHFDIVTNVMILNSVSILSAVFQVVAECLAKERKRLIMLPVLSIIFIVLGYVLFVVNYLVFESSFCITIGLAIFGTICVSMNWWENYSTLFNSLHLKGISKDIGKSRNAVNIISSLTRILITSAVIGAYVTLTGDGWNSVKLVFETVVIALVVIQTLSSALCRWFVVVACKMHALRRSFFMPMYFASVIVLAVFLSPLVVKFPVSNYTSIPLDKSESSVEWVKLLLADAIKTLLTRDIVVNMKTEGLVCLGCSALFWWLGLVLSTVYIWFLKIHRIERTQDLFVQRMYEGAFLEQSLLLNTRFEIRKKIKDKKCAQIIRVFLCATMWHETYDEMMKIIISMFRLDAYRPKTGKHSDIEFEFHVYFDDAFKDDSNQRERLANEYVEILVEVIKEVYIIFSEEDPCVFKKMQPLPTQKIISTPYGGRLEYTLPKGNVMMVHLKDKQLIRHKKRWSQIMYLYYILGWRLNKQYYEKFEAGEEPDLLKEKLKRERENTYILALDGDTDFQPSAVMLLIDRLKLYPEVGAACGRIHPTGTGPMVWYQKFEYAVGHWLQKTAEHVFGCVLCSPGCFSLFRGAALVEDNVMKRYTTKASEASHYVQYDQGEDRWLCTLLLQQGWRVEYNAASDAYTNAPQDFKEFYNQRRRWGPSTMANTIDLLGSGQLTSQRNSSISKLYILYQIISMAASILGPATICLMISGSFVFIFNMNENTALALAIVPPTVYLILCFKLKSDTQIRIAAIMSIIYAFLMAGTILSIIGDLVKQNTFLTPSGLFLIGMVMLYVITAALHPQEFSLVVYGLLYFICIPSGYLLLAIYSIVNMNNVSWGTRESGGQTKTSAVNSLKKKFMNATCCKCPCLEYEDETSKEILPAETITKTETSQITLDIQSANVFPTSPYSLDRKPWIQRLQPKFGFWLKSKSECKLSTDEVSFWMEMQNKYLEPLMENKEQQEKIANDLRELRNKVTFVFFFCNALWLAATFFLQTIGDAVSIKIPKIYPNGTHSSTETLSLDPIALMFLLSFAVLLIMQFLGMLYHRIYTLIHYVAYADTEIKAHRKQSEQVAQIVDSNHHQETTEDDGTLWFQNPSTIGHITAV
nr:uncharacterized protein si:ch211-264e16.2 isoform X1 [Danio rerio]|eukprot:XP_021323454.1 uncharacterized protein si:ch211-264e16.2 isoform X1 [Danio rerio]